MKDGILETAIKTASRVACDSTMGSNIALMRQIAPMYNGKDGEFAVKDLADKMEKAIKQ